MEVPDLFLVMCRARVTIILSAFLEGFFNSFNSSVHDLENFLNPCEQYWGPLSINTTLDLPCRANILLIWVMTISDEAFGS